MTTLLEKVKADKKEALRTKNTIRKNVITILQAELKQIEVDVRREVTDTDVVEIATKMKKRLKDTIPDFTKAGRMDLVEQAEKEMAILDDYLPPAASDDDIYAVTRVAILGLALATVNVGKVKGDVIQRLKKKGFSFDGKRVGEIVEAVIKESI